MATSLALPEAEVQRLAERFGVAPETVQARIADLAQDAQTVEVEFKVARRERDLARYLRKLYNRQTEQKFRTCGRCQYSAINVDDLVAHHRLHILTGPNSTAAARAASDIDHLLYPEATVTARTAIPVGEDRAAILRRLLEPGSDPTA